MPRLSLYQPEKGNNFKFLDRTILEQFQVGGTDIFVHKYIGPVIDPNNSDVQSQRSSIFDELSIQDVILMENRDRHYSPDVYVMRGIYTMQDLDFNLSQFGIFLNNDNIFLHFHLRNCVDILGRKLMAGDVLELPHLKDEYALDDATVALKRFYVVQDVTRAASGFSQTWYPHLLRVKCVPLVDSQEYSEILDKDAGAGNGSTIGDLISNKNQSLALNDLIIGQAEADAPLSGYDVDNLYVVPVRMDDALVDIANASDDVTDASLENTDLDASAQTRSYVKDFYVGYMTEDGRPPNGAPYTFGNTFPTGSLTEGQFHLRTDFYPNVLFRWDGRYWLKFEQNVRMTLTNSYDPNTPNVGSEDPNYTKKTRQTQKTGFINNNNTATIAGKVVPERQALSKALQPKADN